MVKDGSLHTPWKILIITHGNETSISTVVSAVLFFAPLLELAFGELVLARMLFEAWGVFFGFPLCVLFLDGSSS